MMETNIDQLSVTDNNELYIYGDIVGDIWDAWTTEDMYPAKLRDLLKGRSGRVDVYINSPGGDVCACMAICNLLKRYSGETVAHIDGLAASAASVIALSCDRVAMPENAFFMVHHAWCDTSGNAAALRKVADSLDAMDKAMLAIYADASSREPEELEGYMDRETWFTGSQAAEIYDKKIQLAAPATKVAAYVTKKDIENYLHKVPDGLNIYNPELTKVAQETERLALRSLERRTAR